MRVWIDITNSPHALFFDPIIRDLSDAGHEVSVTARDYAQTVDLLAQKGIQYSLIGRHRGANTSAKAVGLLSRSTALIAYGRGKRFDVAFSHNSNDLAVAAWMLRIPHLVVHDYEHAKTSYAVNARLATRILVPDAIPTAAIVAHGARPEKVGHFPGLKEHVYLGAGHADRRPAGVRRRIRRPGAGRAPATRDDVRVSPRLRQRALLAAHLGDRRAGRRGSGARAPNQGPGRGARPDAAGERVRARTASSTARRSSAAPTSSSRRAAR